MTDTSPAAPSFDQHQAVIDRLLPLTTPFASADQGLKEHLVAAWFERLQALRAQGLREQEALSADALAQHLEGSPPQDWHWLAQALFTKGRAQAGAGEFDAALETWRTLEQRFDQTESAPVREWLVRTGREVMELTVYRGATFARVDMVREADRLEQRFGKDEWPATQLQMARIRYRKAELLDELDYHQQALEHFEQLKTDFAQSSFDDLREVAADAALARANLLARKDKSAALQAMQELLQTFAGATHTGIQQTLAQTQLEVVKLWHLSDLEAPEGSSKFEQTIAACERMEAQVKDTDSTVEVRCLGHCLKLHAEALHQQADEQEDLDEDETAALIAQGHALTEQHWLRHAGHADAQVRRLALSARINSLDMMAPASALTGYEQLLQQLGQDHEPSLQLPLARAWFNQTHAHYMLDQKTDALATAAALVQRFGTVDEPAVQMLVYNARRYRVRILNSMGERQTALAELAELEQMPEPEELSEAQRNDWHLQQAKSMDLEADIWEALSPPQHEHASGKDEEDQPIADPEMTQAELQHAAVAERMLQRFGEDESTAVRTAVVDTLFNLAVCQRDRLHFAAAEQTYQKLLDQFAQDKSASLEGKIASAYLNLAYLQMQLMQHNEDALKTYDALLAHCSNSTRPIARDTVARANASRLTCLNRLQTQGVQVSFGEQYEDVTLEQRDALRDLVNKGKELQDISQYREAIAQFDQVIDAHVESLHPELRARCLDALVNKGYCLSRLAQREAALAINNEIIARYGDEMNLTAEKDVALAMSNKAVQLDKLGRHDEEIEVYDEIIRRWQNNTLSYLRQRVARAMWSKAMTLAESDVATAEALYCEVIERYLHAPEPEVRLEAIKACVSLGAMQRKQGRYEENVTTQEENLEALEGDSAPGAAEQLNWMRLQLARSYGKTGRIEQQRAMYERLMMLPKGELDSTQLNAVIKEYEECKPDTGLQLLRKKIIGLFGGKG